MDEAQTHRQGLGVRRECLFSRTSGALGRLWREKQVEIRGEVIRGQGLYPEESNFSMGFR